MAAAPIATGLPGANAPLTPRLVGDWWTAAGDPDLGPLTTPKQQPVDFGIDNDAEHYVTTLPVAAPEVFQQDGQWFMAALLPTLKGIQITRMEWVPAP